MLKRCFLLLICLFFCSICVLASDYRSREIKYQYGVLKNDLKNERNSKILNRTPSGYMTVEEYEKASEYKDKTQTDFPIPQLDLPSDFKYVPQPLYKIVRYNNPPGRAELTLGKRLFALRQINAQGITSPDFSLLVYPAVYYYPDSAAVATDLFVIPLEGENNIAKMLRANVAKKNPEPIMSTDKTINSYAAFRTLTPVDFSEDGKKLLVKEKLGSSEDGIWETKIYIYDFDTKLTYDLSDVRGAVVYFWKEYMKVNLDAKRWDIYPLGFLREDVDRVAVQAYAYTGETPIYLGAWSIDIKGNQSQLISFDKDAVPAVSSNGFKLLKDGAKEYQTVVSQEKYLKQQSKVLIKQSKNADKELVKSINDEYKYKLKDLDADYKDDYKNYKKLRSLSGSTSGTELEAAYNQYLLDQANKDIEKTNKQIEKQQKKIDKLDEKIKKMEN
ncbi:hypothetical protein IJ579_06405 [bacterium]|nr:hypothetical protein [bacterium]